MRAGTPARPVIPSFARPSRVRSGAGASSTRWPSSSSRAERPHRALKGNRAHEHDANEARATRAPSDGVGGDEEHVAPVGADRRQGAYGLHRSTKPLVARHSVRRRAWPDDASHAGERRCRLRDRLRLRRAPPGGHDQPRGGGVVRARRRALRRRVRREAARDARRASGSTSRSASSRTACRRRRRSRRTGSTPRTTETRSSASGTSSSGRTRCSRSSRAGTAARRSPVHLFWHSFDLALTRFGGARAPALPDADPVDQETYSHEVVSFGFWAGDANVREPTYYSYTAPEPAGLRQQPLHPARGILDRVREAARSRSCPTTRFGGPSDPRAALLAFLESAYRAGAGLSGWDQTALDSSWCPSPPELSNILAGLEPTPRPAEE